MGKLERVFYFSIIVIEFFLIIFLSMNIHKFKKASPQIVERGTNPTINRLYSFWGNNNKGETELIHFTANSDRFYIFVVFSLNCEHCKNLIDEILYEYNKLGDRENIRLLYLTADAFDKTGKYQDIDYLKLSNDDIVQFGFDIPLVVAVNGKGEILAKQVGYSKGIFEKFLGIIRDRDFRKKQKKL